jgi:hypothetical protein
MFLLLKQVAGSSRFGFGSFASFLTFLMVSACGGGVAIASQQAQVPARLLQRKSQDVTAR